jgi:hypothetical protein
MDTAPRTLIERLHAVAPRYVLAVTGGGTGAAAQLLSVPGGSRSLLEVVVPYDERSLCDFLASRPASFCSLETAVRMASRARERACWLAPGPAIAGVGCTASLRSDRPKRGQHRFHLAIHTSDQTLTFSLILSKGARDREGEETVVDLVLLNAVAEAFALVERVAVPLLPAEEIVRQTHPADDPLSALYRGRFDAVCAEPDGRQRSVGPRPLLLLSGSFNPLHQGHITLAAAAARRSGIPAAYELTILNADKPPLPIEEVHRRIAQFAWLAPLWLTRAATFAEKAALFPGAIFVVGADTAERIVQPRFYGGDEARLAEAMDQLRRRGCRFLVAGRINAAGVFQGLDDIGIPPAYGDLFASISAPEFRLDVSSTQLRGEATATEPRP